MDSFKEIEFKTDKPIKDLFPSLEIVRFIELSFVGRIVSVFVKFKDLDSLKDNWKDLNGFITANFITKLEDEFSKWNCYLFYLSNSDIYKTLKYEIENNKFGTRKIVIPDFTKELTTEEVGNIIAEHITNSSMPTAEHLVSAQPFAKDKRFSKYIEKLPLAKKGEWEIEYNNALGKIEELLKNES